MKTLQDKLEADVMKEWPSHRNDGTARAYRPAAGRPMVPTPAERTSAPPRVRTPSNTTLNAHLSIGCLWLGCGGLGCCVDRRSVVADRHLTAARDLVARVDLDRTRYEHGQGTVDFGATPSSYTDCSGLIDHLLMHSYGYRVEDFRRWFGSSRPSARRYYDAIVAQSGFVHLERVTDLRPGDLISVKYLRESENTGHIMIVNQRPERPCAAGCEPDEGRPRRIIYFSHRQQRVGMAPPTRATNAARRPRPRRYCSRSRIYVDGADRVTIRVSAGVVRVSRARRGAGGSVGWSWTQAMSHGSSGRDAVLLDWRGARQAVTM